MGFFLSLIGSAEIGDHGDGDLDSGCRLIVVEAPLFVVLSVEKGNESRLKRMIYNLIPVDGSKVEDVKKPVNPISFLLRFILGTNAATYYVLVPIYMWIKDQIFPKGMTLTSLFEHLPADITYNSMLPGTLTSLFEHLPRHVQALAGNAARDNKKQQEEVQENTPADDE
ncbi:uncharacterized protein A4U43_C09F7940 [Asparagus officinalis]|uniref:Uncharacterized protein n=1 Tax=Asparagus officinalis TaxID=4686 RepID=A0A5P1E7T7_ASPOF|nr:uncharacterized protein A4U43_C09F7940 [Asparagus officinalis]